MATDYKQYNYSAIYCGASFASQGCGPTSVADLLDISPLTVAQWMTNNGYATTDGHGTYWGGINAALTAFGAGGKMIGSSLDGQTSCAEFDEWKRVIQSGYMGVLLMHNVVSSMWTTGGHYIACVSYDANTDQYLIYDPASVSRTGWHPWSHFIGNICCLYTSTKKWGTPKTEASYSFKTVEVKIGDNNKYVKLMQRLLAGRGYYAKKSIDGSFGAKTKTAVEKFQTKNNLKVDGICGPATWASLTKFDGTTKTVYEVKFGDENESVYLLQVLLTAYGYYAGSRDGLFGMGTRTALKEFQTKKKIAVDGVCGPTTWRKLIGY